MSVLPLPATPQEWQAILLTLKVAGLAVGGGLPLAMLCAWVLTKKFPGQFVLNAVIHMPLALPPVVTGWLLLIMLGVEGPIGSWLHRAFGIQLAFTTAGAALACGVMVFPVMVRAIRQGFENVDQGLLEAAQMLGAARIDRFWTIAVPLAAPGLLLAVVMGYTASLGEFGAVITFAANIPGQTQTLPLAIYSALQVPGGEHQAAHLAMFSVILAMAGLLLAERLATRLRRGA